jgi:hypothetical protein
VSPLTIALTSEASTWAMLMLGFGGFGFAAFSVGMKVGQIAEAAWWKGKLQEALTSTREPPPPRQMSLVRDRRELRESPLRPGSLLRRPLPLRQQGRSLRAARLGERDAALLAAQDQGRDVGLRQQGASSVPSAFKASQVSLAFGLPEQHCGPWKQLGGWDGC